MTEDCRKIDINDERNINILAQLVKIAEHKDYALLSKPDEEDGQIVSAIDAAFKEIF